jgi:hypothetical protein
MAAMSRGDLDLSAPTGRMQLLQSFKNLHANLRYLTWKTQQITGSDLTQQVDFMGDFSKAFNSMTHQLREAFAKIERQNHELSRAHHRMKKDLDAAVRVQRTLLPEGFPEIPGLSFAWSYRPCDELAGDFLNIVRINDSLIGLYLLDVSGHGVPAALLSVTVTRGLTFRAGTATSLVAGPGKNPEAVPPAQVAARLNEVDIERFFFGFRMSERQPQLNFFISGCFHSLLHLSDKIQKVPLGNQKSALFVKKQRSKTENACSIADKIMTN